MGVACSTARRTAIEIIPDRSVMIEIVDQIKAFEDLLRQGQPLSAKEAKELAKLNRVTKEMKRINVNKSRKKARDSVRGAPGGAVMFASAPYE